MVRLHPHCLYGLHPHNKLWRATGDWRRGGNKRVKDRGMTFGFAKALKGGAPAIPTPCGGENLERKHYMLKIELTDFQDEQAFDLDLKTSSGPRRFQDHDANSISIRFTSDTQCRVRRCLDYVQGAANTGFGSHPASHGKHPRKSFSAAKPGRPCRIAKARS